jgi:hypothetical protein
METTKLAVQVSFVIEVPKERLGEDGGFGAAVDYCREMFAAVSYPNNNGEEWYLERVESLDTEEED